MENLTEWRRILFNRESTDPILECPSSVTSLLESRPAMLIKIAHSKIHSFQYDQVPTCWRRLYTDGSICLALQKLEEWKSAVIDSTGISSSGLDDVVRLLDMAKIIAGAPGRDGLIEEMFAVLQDAIDGEDDLCPQPKRRKLDTASFPRIGLHVPIIEYHIERVSSPSFSDFERRLDGGSPLVITDSLFHWPALHERPWKSPSYLLRRTIGGRRLVPIELGRSYTDTSWGQSIMPFKDFMEQYLTDSSQCDGSNLAYLAQHDLFAQVPELRNDISTPDYCFTEPPPPAAGTPLAAKPVPAKLNQPLLNAWFGPAGTVSPLHTDPYHNVLCQVVGRKYVRLYGPDETKHLYPRTIGPDGVDMSNTSLVDAESQLADLREEFPSFLEAKYVETIIDEGEALYIPVGWWHYVRSVDISFSVSFWWN